MKTKNLVIIFILFLLLTLGGGLVIFFTEEKEQPVLNRAGEITNSSSQPVAEEKPAEIIKNKPVSEVAGKAKSAEPELVVQPEKTVPIETGGAQNKQIQAIMLINGVEYRIAMKPDSSVYNLMNTLKEQKRIDFKGKDYFGLGFFVEEINGLKNNPAGKNWLYYVNGRPGQVGVFYYKLKNNDTIEWKYENKNF